MENANHEEEIKILKETNNELVQKVQHFKMKVTQCENDKLYLMKENNDLRLKLTRLQSAEAAQARALDSALQSASEEALSHLVQASTAVARTIDLTKSYIRDRQNLEISSVRWSTIGGTPAPPVREKVHKVAPLMMGGRSIQPFVSLDRIPLNNNINASLSNQNQNVTERVLPLPMHILQDVYIPLRRIDMTEFLNHSAEAAQNQDDDDTAQQTEEPEENPHRESDQISDAREYDDEGLNVINEESEIGDDDANANTSSQSHENPLEGPSWLLDMPRGRTRDRVNFEPDSTTEVDESISNIDALRLAANQSQSQSQSPILESRRHRSPEAARLVNRAVPGCSQVRNDRQHRETSSNTPTLETRSSTNRHGTPKSNVTVRRRSPQCGRVIKESPGDRSQELGNRSGGLRSGTPGQLDVGVESELTPSPLRLAFTPTVRRKRTSPLVPPLAADNTPSPPAPSRRSNTRRNRKNSRSTNEYRILKVLVPKIDIESLENSNLCDSQEFLNTPNALEGNRSEQETSNTENRLKRIEIRLSRTDINVNRNTIGNNDSVASTSRNSDNRANMSGNGATTSGNGATTSETPPNLSEIASTSGFGHNRVEQSDRGSKKGKGRPKNGRKGKARGDGSGDASPAKRRALCKSASPNVSTDSAMEQESELRPSTNVSGSSAASDVERTRRPRKLVTYKEKSLNIKLRRI